MKKTLFCFLLVSCILLLCACGQNSEYEAVLKEISQSECAYTIIQPYLSDEEAMTYILKKIAPENISKLFVEDLTSYYGSAHAEHTTEVGEAILKTMSDKGFENFPKETVLSALKKYLPSTPGYSQATLSSLEGLDGDDFYTAAADAYSKSSSSADAENILITEAYKRAKKQLLASLKNPNSYNEVSIMGSSVDYDPETGEYGAVVVITYTATNSFGAELQDTYTYTESGTFIDGQIKYNN